MNIYVMLIAGLVVVLMVMFGRNPVEEAQEARATKKAAIRWSMPSRNIMRKKRMACRGMDCATAGSGFQSIGRSRAGASAYMMNNGQNSGFNSQPISGGAALSESLSAE